MSCRAVLADPSTLLRTTLAARLLDAGVVVVAHADDAEGLLGTTADERPDVVVADADLLTTGATALHDLVAMDARILALSRRPSPVEATELLARGLRGYLSHQCSVADLCRAALDVAAGRCPLDPSAAAAVVHQWRVARDSVHAALADRRLDLSVREAEVLDAMTTGMSVPAIAHRFGLSRKTVESHKARIYSKLGVRTQAEAVRTALADGLATRAPDRACGRA